MGNHHTRAHLARGVYEGIAFCHRYHFEKLMRNRRFPPESIRLAGGVARSKEWVRIFTNVMGYPIEVVEVNETGTLGSVIAAAVAAGEYPSMEEAVRHMTKVVRRVEPEAAEQELYDRKYRLYCRVIESLDPVWNDMKLLYT